MDKSELGVFDLLREPILMLGPGGELLYANPAARELSEAWDPEALENTALWETGEGVGPVDLGGRTVTASLRPWGENRILTVLAQKEEEEVERDLLCSLSRELSEHLSVQSAALEHLSRETGLAVRDTLASLWHRHYALRRLAGELAIAGEGEDHAGLTRVSRFDLADLVRETVSMTGILLQNRRAELRFRTEVEYLPYQGDAVLLEQMLLQLLANALTFTPEDGTVTVSLRKSGRMVYLGVRDNGPGIRPERLGALFTPGAVPGEIPLPGENTGLGLTVVRRAVHLHGGSLAVDSGKEGTCVLVSLPLTGSEDTLLSPIPVPPWDDEAILLTELSGLLKAEDYLPRG